VTNMVPFRNAVQPIYVKTRAAVGDAMMDQAMDAVK
jgi:hypothetical protein